MEDTSLTNDAPCDVHILMFKQGTNIVHHRYTIDIILSQKDADFVTFKKRLLDEERIDEVRQKVGLMRSDVLIGYWKKGDTQGKWTDFKQSFSNSQWAICRKKVLANPDTFALAGRSTLILIMFPLRPWG